MERSGEGSATSALASRPLPARCFDIIHHDLKISIPSSNITKKRLREEETGVDDAIAHSKGNGADEKTKTCGGLFVTWEKKVDEEGGEYDLRGCIGALSEISIDRGIKNYTRHSAFRDSRFRPIARSEVRDLKCSVSLLHSFEECDNAHDWSLDTHGIIINFTVRGIDYSATYLPHVAAEQGWDKRKTIDSLVRKSGYRGHHVDHSTISVTRYQSEKTSMSYAQYADFCAKNPQNSGTSRVDDERPSRRRRQADDEKNSSGCRVE